MARPDYIICLECETEVKDFSWRTGEIHRAKCEACGNDDPDTFSLPDDFDSAEDEAQDEDEDENDYQDYGDDEDEKDE